MKHKTLRIIFSGICTLTPGPPRNGEKPREKPHPPKGVPAIKPDPPQKAFVMMAENVENAPAIEKHFPFVHVARSLLGDDAPWPSETVVAAEGGEQWIYFFRHARLGISPRPIKDARIEYFIDWQGRPLAERPGSDDVAPQQDIRWLADMREILPDAAAFRKTANPTAKKIDDSVAAIVDLDAGLLRANFPCDSVHPRPFVDAKGNVVPGRRRALASEFIIDIPYPLDTEQITLRFDKLRSDTPVDGPAELVLLWPRRQPELLVRMGYDTLGEVRRMNTPARFDPVRETGPVRKPRDDEFELHYNLLDIPQEVARVVPQNDLRQCSREGCKPAIAGPI